MAASDSTTHKNLYAVNGTYYAYLILAGKRFRFSLKTKDIDTALERLAMSRGFYQLKIQIFAHGTNKQISSMFDKAKERAKKRNSDFCLTREEIKALFLRANGKCELTGIHFNYDEKFGGRRSPFAPSLDRINSKLGYQLDNCRLVCVAMNLALQDWGEEVFKQIALGFHVNHRGKSAIGKN